MYLQSSAPLGLVHLPGAFFVFMGPKKDVRLFLEKANNPYNP